ncbi:MAG TPA: response regulator [Planctomycetota bacterium]|nr:response regulator [Planctomycetota bacterium]
MPDRFRELFLNFGEAIFIENGEGLIIEANPAAAKLLECRAEDLGGRKLADLLTPVSRERLSVQRLNLAPGQHRQFDAQLLSQGGNILSVIIDVSQLPDEAADSSRPALVYVARVTSKLDELERELRLQRQSALSAFGSVQHQVFFISARNEISPYPPLGPGDAIRPLDWVHTLLLGARLKPSLDRAWSGEAVTLPCAWYSPAEGGAWHPSYSGIMSAVKDVKKIEQRWLQMSFVPVRLKGSEVSDVCVHVLDCTADRVEREEARAADVQRAAGVLTAALQHELNNYLSIILAQASGMRMAMGGAGALPPPNLGAIMDAAQNAASLLRRAVDTGTIASNALAEVDLNALALDCAQLLPHLVHGRLRVETDLAADLPPVRGDAFALKTMLMSLAREAENNVPQGGHITLRTYRGQPPYPGLPPTAGVIVQDNAPSISKREAAVDLSAPAGVGESIELALARTIVREHRGQLEAERSSSKGRTWSVTLPGLEKPLELGDPMPAPIIDSPRDVEELEEKLSAVPAERRSSESQRRAPASPPSEENRPAQRILIADDEENFRQFAGWILKERGYEVVTAIDGQEAFEKFQEAPAAYHLVILDSYMPRMGGLESYLRMQVLRPDLPVLFASGFARGASMDALIDGCPGPAGVLLKPFSADDLAEAVKKALTPAPQDF